MMRRRDKEGLRDLIQRAAPGRYVHVAIWLLVAVPNSFPRSCPVLFWSVTASMLGLFIARKPLGERALRSFEAGHKQGFGLWLFALLAPCMLWSGLAVSSVRVGPLHVAEEELILMVVGLATSGAVVLSIDRIVTLWYSLVAMLPIVIALAIDGTADHIVLALMGGTVLLYISAATKLVHKDYWAALDARCGLEDRTQDLETLSTTDPLTQIANRRLFEQRLDQAWSNAALAHSSVSVLMVDLDHFKLINDTHGHGCGDDCLKATAGALSASLHRKNDLVARWGGEEFIVLLAGLNTLEIEMIAQRLRRSIEVLAVEAGRVTVKFTCSIGVASGSPDSYDRPEQLIAAADSALYTAKQQGRNRVVEARAA